MLETEVDRILDLWCSHEIREGTEWVVSVKIGAGLAPMRQTYARRAAADAAAAHYAARYNAERVAVEERTYREVTDYDGVRLCGVEGVALAPGERLRHSVGAIDVDVIAVKPDCDRVWVRCGKELRSVRRSSLSRP